MKLGTIDWIGLRRFVCLRAHRRRGPHVRSRREQTSGVRAGSPLVKPRNSVGEAKPIRRPYSAPPPPGYRDTGSPFASAPAATRRDLPGHHRRRFLSGTIFLSGTFAGWLTIVREAAAPILQRLGLLVLVLMKVVGADDAGWPVRKHGLRDVVRDA